MQVFRFTPCSVLPRFTLYVCINVLCVMRQMYTVCILYRINNIENADNARTQKTLI